MKRPGWLDWLYWKGRLPLSGRSRGPDEPLWHTIVAAVIVIGAFPLMWFLVSLPFGWAIVAAGGIGLFLLMQDDMHRRWERQQKQREDDTHYAE